MNVYDTMAQDFDRHRALPDGVPETIRRAILRSIHPPRPKILDLGAGAGRIGRAFVHANDDYTGIDLSSGMLRAFAASAKNPRLVQADGAHLPFPDATFDAILLVQVLSGTQAWRQLLTGAIRTLRSDGVLIVGRVVAPPDGIDARMKTRLAEILDAIGIHPYRDKPRDDALSWLARVMPDHTVVTAATWTTQRTPSAFLDRHTHGARFSVLPPAVKRQAIEELTSWANERFGTTVFTEAHRFELIIHRLQQGITT